MEDAFNTFGVSNARNGSDAVHTASAPEDSQTVPVGARGDMDALRTLLAKAQQDIVAIRAEKLDAQKKATSLAEKLKKAMALDGSEMNTVSVKLEEEE